MTAQLRLVAPGPLASVQDFGRFGHRRFGVPQSGVLHPALARVANVLAGNSAETALIEFFLVGPSFHLEKGQVRLALAGDFRAELTRNGVKRSIHAWRSITLNAGDRLALGAVKSGKVGYVAVAGGLDLAETMGSKATYLRGGFGGVDGKRLQSNMLLPLPGEGVVEGPERHFARPFKFDTLGLPKANAAAEPTCIRVILGPQEDYFTSAALKDFLSGIYTVSRDSDRMGSRLDGPPLEHEPTKVPEIVSDGIVPGAIQVPGNGAPIVLLADGPTVGGYPKIATVVSADLAKFSVLPPGSRIRFEAVCPEEAEDLLRNQRQELDRLLGTIEPLSLENGIDSRAIYEANLVSGAVDALLSGTQIP